MVFLHFADCEHYWSKIAKGSTEDKGLVFQRKKYLCAPIWNLVWMLSVGALCSPRDVVLWCVCVCVSFKAYGSFRDALQSSLALIIHRLTPAFASMDTWC